MKIHEVINNNDIDEDLTCLLKNPQISFDKLLQSPQKSP